MFRRNEKLFPNSEFQKTSILDQFKKKIGTSSKPNSYTPPFSVIFFKCVIYNFRFRGWAKFLLDELLGAIVIHGARHMSLHVTKFILMFP